MPLPNQYATIRVVYGDEPTNPMINVLHYVLETAATVNQQDAETLISSVAGALTDPYKSVLPTECNLYGFSGLVHNNDLSFAVTFTVAIQAGGIASDTTPEFAAWIIRKQTAVGGKSGRGRFYIGCVPEIFTNTSVLGPTPIATECENLRAALFSNLNTMTHNWIPAHLSVKNNTMLPITSMTIVPELATQRRRRVRPLL